MSTTDTPPDATTAPRPTTVGAYEAKTKLAELLDRVEAGEHITITRHGKAVAQLVPARRHDPERAREAFRRMRERAEKSGLDDLTWEEIKSARDEGRDRWRQWD